MLNETVVRDRFFNSEKLFALRMAFSFFLLSLFHMYFIKSFLIGINTFAIAILTIIIIVFASAVTTEL